MSACTRIGCGGHILSDGYCDTCGYAGQPSAAAPPAHTSPPPPPAAPQSVPPPPAPARPTAPGPPPPGSVPASRAGQSCTDTTCSGSIAADGYCDTCGLQPSTGAPTGGASPSAAPGETPDFTSTIAVPTAPRVSATVASTAAGSTRRSRTSATARTELGAGLVRIAPTSVGDPSTAVMGEEQIRAVLGEKPEDERFCSACGQPVGRGHGEEPGRIKGFCGNCRTPFDFHTNMPKLSAGTVVGGQYLSLIHISEPTRPY